ncbi:MAG TPA: hypothetical protein VJN72_06300 [Gaiellales bacterium]|nr:hypothetical protein [Gaiellales bacterium]
MSSGAATVRQWSADIQRFVDDWPAQAAEVLARAVDERARADTGGDGRFSHGKKLGRADVDVDAGRTSADVFGAGSIGLWAILENGTRKGVQARRTWTRGVDAGMALVERDADTAWQRVGG